MEVQIDRHSPSNKLQSNLMSTERRNLIEPVLPESYFNCSGTVFGNDMEATDLATVHNQASQNFQSWNLTERNEPEKYFMRQYGDSPISDSSFESPPVDWEQQRTSQSPALQRSTNSPVSNGSPIVPKPTPLLKAESPKTENLKTIETNATQGPRLNNQFNYENHYHNLHQENAFSLLDRLYSNYYLQSLRLVETKLESIKHQIVQGGKTLNQSLPLTICSLRFEMEQYQKDFETLKTEHFLSAVDFNNILSLENHNRMFLFPQLSLYEGEAHNSEFAKLNPVQLTILKQQNSGLVFKDKPIGSFVLKLLCGATVTEISTSNILPELVDIRGGKSKSKERNIKDMMNSHEVFDKSGVATFTDLKFSSGTYPNLISLKFTTTVTSIINGEKITKKVESQLSKPFIVMTNSGSQWKEALGVWIKDQAFEDHSKIPMARFYNYFQQNYLVATKQDTNSVGRCLEINDFEYLMNAKFKQGLFKQSIQLVEFYKFWDWFGPYVKKIRYQKHMGSLFESGLLACFITGEEASTILSDKPEGTFLIRLSERINGEFVITYKYEGGVRHYLLQPEDVTDKKRTFIDFLVETHLFVYILQAQISSGTKQWITLEKHKVLEKFYKKKVLSSTPIVYRPGLAYDTTFPKK